MKNKNVAYHLFAISLFSLCCSLVHIHGQDTSNVATKEGAQDQKKNEAIEAMARNGISVEVSLDSKTGVLSVAYLFRKTYDYCIRMESLGAPWGIPASFGFYDDKSEINDSFGHVWPFVSMLETTTTLFSEEEHHPDFKSFDQQMAEYDAKALTGELVEELDKMMLGNEENFEPKIHHRCIPVFKDMKISIAKPIWDYCPALWKKIKTTYGQLPKKTKRDANRRLYIRILPSLYICDGDHGFDGKVDTKILCPKDIEFYINENDLAQWIKKENGN